MIVAQASTSWTGAVALMGGIGLLLLASGWLVVEIANRTADGRIGPNGFAGIRTKATCSSPEAWMAAHQAGHRLTRLSGFAFGALGVLSPVVAWAFSSDDPDGAVAVWGVLVLAGSVLITGLVAFGGWQGHTAAKNLRPNSSSA